MRKIGSLIDQPSKVLFLAGFGRSGSTILANILGQAAGIVAVGEIGRMWETALVQRHACGCRRLVDDCPFWNEVFDHAFGGIDSLDPEEMNYALRKFARTRHILLRPAQSPPRSEPADLVALRSKLAQLYRSIAEISGAKVIVDSSKLPAYGNLLDQVPGIEIYVVHLVRDPRASAYSWARKRVQPVTGLPSMGKSLTKSALLWTGLNLAVGIAFESLEAEKRYLFLKYETFASRPRTTFFEILKLFEEQFDGDPFVSDTKVKLTGNHNIAGSVSRFENGLVEIAVDKEWEVRMSASRKLLVSALSWPLMKRYQYPILPPGIN